MSSLRRILLSLSFFLFSSRQFSVPYLSWCHSLAIGLFMCIANIPSPRAIFPGDKPLSPEKLIITCSLLQRLSCFLTQLRAEGKKQLIMKTGGAGDQAAVDSALGTGEKKGSLKPTTLWDVHHTLSSGASGSHIYLPPLILFQGFPCFPCLSRSDLWFLFDGTSVGNWGVCVEREAGENNTNLSAFLAFPGLSLLKDHSLGIAGVSVFKPPGFSFHNWVYPNDTGLLSSFPCPCNVSKLNMWLSTRYCRLRKREKFATEELEITESVEFGFRIACSVGSCIFLFSLTSHQEFDLEAKLRGAWFIYEANREFYFSFCKKLEFFPDL